MCGQFFFIFASLLGVILIIFLTKEFDLIFLYLRTFLFPFCELSCLFTYLTLVFWQDGLCLLIFNMWRKLAFSIWAELWDFVFSLPFVWKTFSHEELLHFHVVELINPFLTKTTVCLFVTLPSTVNTLSVFVCKSLHFAKVWVKRSKLVVYLQVALHLFTVHLAEGYLSSVLIWNASFWFYMPASWVCLGLCRLPSLLHSWGSPALF